MGRDGGPDPLELCADGRTVAVTHPGRVLHPEAGFTKGAAAEHLAAVAPLMLPRVRGRPASFRRYPAGVGGEVFSAKNAPRGTPARVRAVRLPSPDSTRGRAEVEYVVADDAATRLWAANPAALEVHVPQWRVGPRGGVHRPDLVVLDLDPGAPADVVACCRVAELLREVLAADGLRAWPKRSGSKGLQLYVTVAEAAAGRTEAYARAVAELLERRHPGLAVSRTDRSLRGGRVFVDWARNNAARTTVAPYSLRARALPTVSTPLAWDEVEACREAEELRFTAPDVLERAERRGDPVAEVPGTRQRLPRAPAAAS